jgi:hypothetical protein
MKADFEDGYVCKNAKMFVAIEILRKSVVYVPRRSGNAYVTGLTAFDKNIYHYVIISAKKIIKCNYLFLYKVKSVNGFSFFLICNI